MLNRSDRSHSMAGEAEVKYLDGDFRIIRPGAFVRCAVTGIPIPLEELKYWSVERQEPYLDAGASLTREEAGLASRAEAENLVGIYAALAESTPAQVLSQFGGSQFSTFKSALVDLAVAKVGPIGAEVNRLMKDPGHIDSVLADGAARAARIAAETMKAVKDIVGLIRR